MTKSRGRGGVEKTSRRVKNMFPPGLFNGKKLRPFIATSKARAKVADKNKNYSNGGGF
jgi:hypothetical protein